MLREKAHAKNPGNCKTCLLICSHIQFLQTLEEFGLLTSTGKWFMSNKQLLNQNTLMSEKLGIQKFNLTYSSCGRILS